MNTDDLRAALQDEAERQPAVSPAFDAGIARRVRRQRTLKALALTPLLAVVVLAAALVMARGSRDATVQTADGGAGTSVAPPATSVVPGTRPTWKGKGVEDRVPPRAPATDPTATTGPTTTPTTGMPGAAPVNGACGSVTVAMTPSATIDTAPFTCFLRALDGGVPADLTVVVTGPEGGSFTDHISTDGPGRMMTVSVEGSMTVSLPDIGFGSGGGPASGDSAGSGDRDCGSISISVSAASAPSVPDEEAMLCLANAWLGGEPATLVLIVQDQRGGAINTTIELGADHRATVTTSGSIIVQLPEGLRVPEDLINAIPPGNMGLNVIPGLSFGGGRGSSSGGGESDPAAEGPPR